MGDLITMNRSLLILAVLAVFCATAYAACDVTKMMSCVTTATTCAGGAGKDKDKLCKCYTTQNTCYKDSGCVDDAAAKAGIDAMNKALKDAGCSPAGMVVPSVIISAVAMFAHFFR